MKRLTDSSLRRVRAVPRAMARASSDRARRAVLVMATGLTLLMSASSAVLAHSYSFYVSQGEFWVQDAYGNLESFAQGMYGEAVSGMSWIASAWSYISCLCEDNSSY